jgi:hypothetical protein
MRILLILIMLTGFGFKWPEPATFDMCKCIEEERLVNPSHLDDVNRKVCLQKYIDYLMELSKERNMIVSGSFIECTE